MFDDQDFLHNLPLSPGVYRMFDAEGALIYVGKARQLKKRVGQYFQRQQLDIKTRQMVAKVAKVEVTLTESETEALLLEARLIKQYHPKYNILMRDDKSYPYLYISTHQDFPRIDYVRDRKKKQGQYFGPYASLGSARETLALLQKCFALRQCKDSVFSHRTRPCLQYQIKRCTAPCVGLVDKAAYRQSVDEVVSFLNGGEEHVIAEIEIKMKAAAADFDYELAAQLRDQIQMLRHLQKHEFQGGAGEQLDIVGVTEQAGKFAIALLRVRAGELASHDCFFPKVALGESLEDVLAGFLRHYYLQTEHRQFFAAKVLMAQRLLDRELLEAAIYQQVGRRIRLVSRASDREKHWLRMANRNAEQALLQRSVKDRQYYGQWQDLKDVLSLTDEFNLIECFDISHTQGESTKAACVVFDSEGASKRRYRQYNVDPHEVAAGDDYAAMRFAVRQRYSKALLEGRALPNLLLIDGGLGQLNAVKAVLDELQIDDVLLLGMAKGRSRKVGMERLLRVDGSLVQLPPHRPAFHLLAHVRDEAHRSGIRAHRRTRDRARTQSGLEVIKGVGPKKREALLRHFGGLQGLKKASVAEIMKVPGITATLAERVKSHLSSL